MTFKQMVILYLVALAVFILVDMVWLTLVAKGFYQKHLGPLLSPRVRWAAAFLFYLVYILGLLIFVMRPAFIRGDALYALFYGALFGLISYATYDLSNLATIKAWPLVVTVVDLVWGTVLGGVVSFLTVALGRWLLR